MKKVLVLGHRGYRARYPENTLLSINKALENNSDGIECDIQKTKDGAYVIFHDYNLERLTGVNGNIDEFDYQFIGSLKVLKTEQNIIELETLLKNYPKDKFINIELKKETLNIYDCQKIYNIIKANFILDNVLISSFEHRLLPFFKKKGVKIGFLFDQYYKNKILRAFFKIFFFRPNYINLPIEMFGEVKEVTVKRLLSFIKSLNIKIVFWTVNKIIGLESIIDSVDIVITDEVELIIDYLKNH